MKKLVLMFIVMALTSPLVASAADAAAATGKNPCLLNSANCLASAQSDIQEIIAKFQNEVNKGASVYSVDELVNLQSKLTEYQALLVDMTAN